MSKLGRRSMILSLEHGNLLRCDTSLEFLISHLLFTAGAFCPLRCLHWRCRGGGGRSTRSSLPAASSLFPRPSHHIRTRKLEPPRLRSACSVCTPPTASGAQRADFEFPLACYLQICSQRRILTRTSHQRLPRGRATRVLTAVPVEQRFLPRNCNITCSLPLGRNVILSHDVWGARSQPASSARSLRFAAAPAGTQAVSTAPITAEAQAGARFARSPPLERDRAVAGRAWA